MNHAAPVEICYENMRFLITSNPNSATMQKFTEELKTYGVKTLVRVCEATYDKVIVEQLGIRVLDLPYDDGAPPPNEVVYNWLELLKSRFQEEPGSCVAVHCVSGLGRKRRGAFNTKQLLFLENYEPKTSARTKSRFRESKVHCCVQ
ncbi:protein tyrosine phosphatase type IVA 2-like isoform X2 [Meriones unguiculatus]|uniref:protein tyrosine phosphatase type IVA 2-like isoform X2 n=1 Tax=Meriones unguiculatus TaxID=10047 RepID=UPI000B4F72B2|nr:protein tyrosine phosphatase type IVA 2-like isoform X2 [Meriones unguiculatus]